MMASRLSSHRNRGGWRGTVGTREGVGVCEGRPMSDALEYPRIDDVPELSDIIDDSRLKNGDCSLAGNDTEPALAQWSP